VIVKINDRIRTRKVEFFNNFRLSLKYDSVASTFAFNFLFNPDNIEHKELACIGHYHIATVEHNGKTLLTGYVLNEGFRDSRVKELAGFSGYSLPGVLEDCQLPLDSLQFSGLSLTNIARKLIKPFDLKMRLDQSVAGRMDQKFDETTAEPAQTIKDFLTELATQKNVVMSHNEFGDLVFTSANTDQKPILNFEDGGVPFTDMDLSFNGQAMHSQITVVKQADSDGGNAGESTVKNPYVPFVHRPKVIVQSSGNDNDTLEVAKQALAAELKNLKLVITTDRWQIGNDIIKPNTIISVKNPKVYLYKKSNWFVESVDYIGNNKELTATLTCVLPEVYNGKAPQYLFKGINLH
jgi:prophage tail gpP-like protein